MTTTDKVNITAGVKVTLFGTELNALFQKDNDGERIIVFQDVTVPNEGLTIKRLIEEVKILMRKQSTDEVQGLSKEEINGKLAPIIKPGTPFDIEAVKITLTTVYLKMVKPSGATDFTTEYAFRIDVDAKDLIRTDINLIKLKQLTFAIWNTEDPKIMKQLALSANP